MGNLPSTTNELKDWVKEINELHAQVVLKEKKHWVTQLEDAIRIGGLLSSCKSALEHGQWRGFVKKNFQFSERASQYYMKAFANQDHLKTQHVADLISQVGWARALDSLDDEGEIRKKVKEEILDVEEEPEQKKLPYSKGFVTPETTKASTKTEVALKGSLTDKTWKDAVINKVVKDVKEKLDTALSKRKEPLKYDLVKVAVDIEVDWEVNK